VERQLKERLIGAAVLVAIAVIMVPEMFSGPHSHSETAANSASASSGEIQTYRIELQSAHSSPAPEVVQQPAPQPRDEVPAPVAESPVTDSSSGSSASAKSTSSESIVGLSSASSRGSNEPPRTQPDVKPKPAAAESSSNPVSAKPDGEWVVQVGSFGTEDKARDIVAKLKGQGFAAYSGKVTVSGKTLYRVRVGAATSRAAAESSAQKIKATYPAATVVSAK